MITYTTNEFGLRQKDMEYMLGLFGNIPAIEKVMLYGSRAAGNFEKGADIDLVLVGKNITGKDIAHIHYQLENESPTLLWFDVLHYDTLKQEALKQQIDEHGKPIYAR
jgi:predicted nucleotidyltransferase